MNEFLRDRIMRRLDGLPDDRLYQVLDFVEFLESKYADRQSPAANVFTKFAETVEDRLRAGRVSASTISETMNLMSKAMGVLNGVAAAGKSVASDIVGAATRPPTAPGGTGPSPTSSPPSSSPSSPPSSSPSSSTSSPPSPPPGGGVQP